MDLAHTKQAEAALSKEGLTSNNIVGGVTFSPEIDPHGMGAQFYARLNKGIQNPMYPLMTDVQAQTPKRYSPTVRIRAVLSPSRISCGGLGASWPLRHPH